MAKNVVTVKRESYAISKKGDKGITLLALIIMIIIILMLAGVVINSGMGAYKEAKLTQFVARMNMVQSRVNVAYADIKAENKKVEDYGISADSVNGSIKNKISNIIPGGNISDYRYLSKIDLEEDLGLQGLNEEIVVNFDTREIYNLEGIEYEGEIFYNQYHLPNGQYNIDFENKTTDAPEFNLSKRNYGLYSYIDVEDIVYKENAEGGKIYYALVTGENDGNVVVDYWRETEEEINIEKTGEYVVKVVDKAGSETIKRVNVVLENAPKLTEDMTAVVYDDSKKQWKKANIEEGKWYDYAENKWANIMMNDGIEVDSNGYITSYGSMFVWIPRYAYNIKSGFHTSTAGDIEVKFLKGTTTLTTDESNITYSQTSGNDKWLVHPAFEDGTKNGYANGEWDRKIEGIWIAKFETSMETNGVHTETSSENIGNVLTNDSIKAVSKPGVSSWRYFDMGNMYENSLNYNKEANSHLIKNSEWGAMTYLTYSKYGTNKEGVMINNSSSFITGNAANEIGDAEVEGVTNAYDTEKGVLASTTGNIYGVYDTAGGAWDYTSAVIQTGNKSIIDYGGKIANIKSSNKYVTLYPIGNSTQEETDISRSYTSWSNIYGDAIWETSSTIGIDTGWYANNIDEDVQQNEPFLLRGASCYNGNNKYRYFTLCDSAGNGWDSYAGRMVLIVQDNTTQDSDEEVDDSIFATSDTTIVAKNDTNIQIVIPKGFAPVILESGRTDSLPGESGVVQEIMPKSEWNNITAEQINKGIVVVDSEITYTDGVSDFNEYVWVPISGINDNTFNRVAWMSYNNAKQNLADGETSNAYWEETDSQMIRSVSINKGFYISRYEASQKDDDSAQSKRGQNPWVYVTNDSARTYSENMKPSINSHLMFGVEYDSILSWFNGNAIISSGGKNKTMDISDIQTNSGNWGNYGGGFSPSLTGNNEYWKANNIYDLTGNVYEWTQERYSTSNYRTYRGGAYNSTASFQTSAFRNPNNSSSSVIRI